MGNGTFALAPPYDQKRTRNIELLAEKNSIITQLDCATKFRLRW